jgi:hypothetical protein
MLLQALQAVKLGSQKRSDRRFGRIAPLRHIRGGFGRVGIMMRLQLQLPQMIATLHQRLRMRIRFLHACKRRAFGRQQVMFDGLEMFGDDVQAHFRQELVNLRHPARMGIFNRHHAERRPALRNRLEHILERGAGKRLHIGIFPAAGKIRVRSRNPHIRDSVFRIRFSHIPPHIRS